MKVLIFFIFYFFFLNFTNLKADEKSNIINTLKKIDNIQFNFSQTTNDITEKGFCILLFPNKLKCKYDNKNRKELIVNEKMMSITQKRYNKTIFYPLSRSNFISILSKKELIKIITSSDLIIDNYLNIVFYLENGSKTLIQFDKNNFLLAGWVSRDQYNNEITFKIDIVSKNKMIDDEIFSLPSRS